jgi:GntR family transcriptional regulator
VREHVRTLVDGAEPGTPAPSERELVAQFGVARMTVRQAMDALVVEGLLERMPGRGTFVARPRRRVGMLSGFSEDMRQRGLLPESQTLLARREQAGPGVARALDISPGDAVIHWKRLRRGNAQVVCIEDAYLNEVLLPGFLQTGMPTSLYDALGSRGLRPTWAEDSVTADLATPDEAQLLELPPGSPVLRVARRALMDHRPVEVSRSAYRADPFTMYVQLGSDA